MSSAEEIMEILDAYDLTGSFRDAGELAGCSHHTVKGYMQRRAAGGVLDRAARGTRHCVAPFAAACSSAQVDQPVIRVSRVRICRMSRGTGASD